MRTSWWQFPPSLKLIRPSVASLQRYCCWYVTWPCDLDLWPFDFGQWSYMAGHVVNPSTKFEDPTAIRSWVMSSDISHRIPLTGEGRSLAGKISGGRGRPLPTSLLSSLLSGSLLQRQFISRMRLFCFIFRTVSLCVCVLCVLCLYFILLPCGVINK